MKKFSQKGVLLFAGAMAVCAFVVPSMASAASWGVIGTPHTLDSPNIRFSVPASGMVLSCQESQFASDVTSSVVLRITTATLRRCTASGAAIGSCTQTSTATGLPWVATATATNNIQIHGVDIDAYLEDEPGAFGSCIAAGFSIRLTGTLTGGSWSGNGPGQHELILSNAPGLQSHSVLGNGQQAAVSGTLRDTQQSLTVTG